MTKSKRGRKPNPANKITLVCPLCGSSFERFRCQVKPNTTPTCSKECGDSARAKTMRNNSLDPGWRDRVRKGTLRGIRRAIRAVQTT